MPKDAPFDPLDPTYEGAARATKRHDERNGRSTMQKTFPAILGAALLAGSAIQPAAASEHHHVRKAQRPVATSQSFRNSNAAAWAAPRREPNRYAPATEPSWPRFYHDEAMSPPAGQ
jgi:hypothetical protein